MDIKKITKTALIIGFVGAGVGASGWFITTNLQAINEKIATQKSIITKLEEKIKQTNQEIEKLKQRKPQETHIIVDFNDAEQEKRFLGHLKGWADELQKQIELGQEDMKNYINRQIDSKISIINHKNSEK